MMKIKPRKGTNPRGGDVLQEFEDNGWVRLLGVGLCCIELVY